MQKALGEGAVEEDELSEEELSEEELSEDERSEEELSEELFSAIDDGKHARVRALLAAGADFARTRIFGETALMAASLGGHLACVRALLEAGADVAQTNLYGTTPLTEACMNGHLECVRALLEADADVMQPNSDGYCTLAFARESLSVLQLLCAYAPSREEVLARLSFETMRPPDCKQWLDATRCWTSPLHHFEFLPLERVRALLVEGADVHAPKYYPADAPTPLGLATARLLRSDGLVDGRAALIVLAAAPWSPGNHALFPAGAKARAVELLRIGWLLARRMQRRAHGGMAQTAEVVLHDVWLGHVMPRAIERSSI